MIYLSVVPALLISALCYEKSRARYHNTTLLLYLLSAFVFLPLLLISGLRGAEVGLDTQRYLELFRHIREQSFSELLVLNSHGAARKEIGYEFFCKFLSLLNKSGQISLFAMALLFLLCFWHMINSLSESPFLSIAVFYGSGLYISSLNIARQMVAVAFIAYMYFMLLKKKHLAAILCCLSAFLFHRSSIIAAAIILLFFFLPVRRWIFGLVSAMALGFPFAFLILQKFYSIIPKRYAQYLLCTEGLHFGLVTVLWGLEFLLVLYLLSFIPDKQDSLTRYDRHIFCCAVFTVLYISATFSGGIVRYADRMGFYFQFGTMFIFSAAAERLRRTQPRFIYFLYACIVYALFIFWIYRHVSQDISYHYQFFF